ncbi:ABC transporter permease [Corynebacterium felinum]|uniref:ABC-2 type transport system permease protein n=1 Tax=Corynebacterium felinum TaxID=131318 RepID=A0ABU2B9Y2_9CORY|nr:ABC transporter permease [Corynebacterium felinum]MDF5821767.1 ABC transporter permease [Corynebacterium felinum]MDR7355426.1 ABC-2 type transport system permease protein [Corynebacterium felinum]WJY94777.1 Daunorubicin/doxorubicin resistance ABC transporter permease protein DrrB [Corynebacterium felinum]
MSYSGSTTRTEVSGSSGWLVAWAHARRLLRSWVRQPGMVVQTALLPLGLLFTLDLTLGDTATALRGGQDQLPSTVALAMVISAAYGSLSAAISCDEERRDGLLARFWVLPTARWAVVAGRLLAEVVRTLVGAIIVLSAGVLLGVGVDSPRSFLLAMLVGPLFVVGFAPVAYVVSLRAGGRAGVENLTGLVMLMMFFNPGLVPVSAYPSWLHSFVEYQPLSVAVATARAWIEGDFTTHYAWWLFGWVLCGVVVLGPVMVRALRDATTQTS